VAIEVVTGATVVAIAAASVAIAAASVAIAADFAVGPRWVAPVADPR
jgi:hypothetical protein